jgi:citrate lyase subunit gamma (acyl carrier protein)
LNIKKQAISGTLLSNDCLVAIEPGDGDIEIQIESIVKDAFGDQIEKAIREKLSEMNIVSCRVKIEDKGALDCTIKARVEVAVNRSYE